MNLPRAIAFQNPVPFVAEIYTTFRGERRSRCRLNCMMLTHDRIYECPDHGGDVRAGSRVVLFVRNATSKDDGVNRGGAGAAYYYVFRSSFLEPCSPNKPSNSAASA